MIIHDITRLIVLLILDKKNMNYKSLSYGERFVYIVPVLPAV